MDTSQLSLADLQSMRYAANQPSPFGNIAAETDFSDVETLADLGHAELRAIEKVLSRMLPRAAQSTLGSGLSFHS